MGLRDKAQLDDPMLIVNAIDDLTTGKSNQFRTVIGNMGNMLMNMRNTIPIEEYMEKMANMF